MDLIEALKHRCNLKAAELAGLKNAVEKCELELHRLRVALDVAEETDLQNLLGELEGLPSAHLEQSSEDGSQDKQSVRDLVLSKLSYDMPLGRMDVLFHLEKDGIKANAATVASTLSKLVRDNCIEKVGHGSYILKRGRTESVGSAAFKTHVFYGGGVATSIPESLSYHDDARKFWASVDKPVNEEPYVSLLNRPMQGVVRVGSVAEAASRALSNRVSRSGKGDAPTPPDPGATMSGEGHDLV